MARRLAALITLVSAASAPLAPWASAEAPAIEHAAVGCIVVDKFPRLEARFDPTENVSRGRVRFRPSGGRHWYSVPMKKEANAFVGVLPKPTKKLKRLDYYVEVTATDFATGRTQEYVPDVVAGLGACQGGKVTAGSLSSATVILEAPVGAPAVPGGFSGAGVVSSTGGVAATGAAVAGGAGIGTAALVAGGVVVGGGVAAAALAASREDGVPSPPSSTVPPVPLVTETVSGVVTLAADGGFCFPPNPSSVQLSGPGPITATATFVLPNIGCQVGLGFGCLPTSACQLLTSQRGVGPTVVTTAEATAPGRLSFTLIPSGPCPQAPPQTGPNFCGAPTQGAAIVPFTVTVTHP